MNLVRDPMFNMLAHERGIILPEAMQFFPEGLTAEAAMALDAQPALVTISNSGIPSYLSNYIDPQLIEVLVTPNRAADGTLSVPVVAVKREPAGRGIGPVAESMAAQIRAGRYGDDH